MQFRPYCNDIHFEKRFLKKLFIIVARNKGRGVAFLFFWPFFREGWRDDFFSFFLSVWKMNEKGKQKANGLPLLD